MDYLIERGYPIDYSFTLSSRAYEVWYEAGHYWTKAWNFIRSHGYRWRETFVKAKQVNLVWVQREALLGPTSYFERWWARRKPLVYDFDDSIWLKDTSEANRLFGWLKRPSKTAEIIQVSSMVTVCNAYLEAYVRQFHERVRRIPTVIDTEKYPYLMPRQRDEVVVGWSGSYTTEKHLRTIEPVLLTLQKKYGSRLRFRFVGVPRYWPSGLRGESLPWRPETEVEDLAEIDIGLMPLPDDSWSRGKCGLKALQYMALGRPAVVSPVSINCEIIQDGQNGFLASTPEEWMEKLSYLIENPEKRQTMGQNARKTVVERYSVQANQDKYVEVFTQALRIGPCG